MSTVDASAPHFRRIILKLSGESLCRSGERGINMEEVVAIAQQIKLALEVGCQIGLVVGGGNILRGAQFTTAAGSKIEAATAHYMGMLATVINALALQEGLEGIGCRTRVMSAIRMDGVCEPFIRRRAIRHMEKGRIVVLAAGTGSPFVTTDTAAAQRALELGADIVLKATKVDGVYSDDPEKNPHAVLYRDLDYDTVISQNLRVMDGTAITQCREHQMPILVFNFKKNGNIVKAVSGGRVGTRIGPGRTETELAAT
jgi:uridylate kinase